MAEEILPEWVKIQEQTFKNWVNYQLAKRDLKIEDIRTDFSDGIKLIILLEILSGNSMGKYEKKPLLSKGTETTVARQAQFLFRQNVDKALTFCQKEGIRLENVGVIDIVEGNRSIIMGLIWSLIMHFQVQPTLKLSTRAQGVPKSPKHQLLEWVQSLIGPSTPYDCNVSGFGVTWSDGRYMSALVESQSPGSFKDWKVVYGDKLENLDKCKRAIERATALGVPPVLSPTHLASTECDELSLVTYLSGFYKQVLTKEAK